MNWHRVIAVMQKYWYNSRRDVFRIFDIFWWPTFELFIWGLLSVYIQKASANNVNLMSMLIGAVVLWVFFDRSSRDISIAMMDDIWNKNLVNMFSTPLRIGEYVVGIMLIAAIKLLISAVFMGLLAAFLYGFNILEFGWYLVPSIIGLTVMGWSISLFIQSIILRFGHTVEVVIWAAAVLVQPFSCVFYPLTTLPVWAQKIALFLPSTYLFENMRSVLFGQPISREQIFVSFGLNIVYLLLSVAFFYKTFRHAKIHGLLVHYY